MAKRPRRTLKNRLVTIERKKLDPDRVYGVIVAQSPILTLLHYEYDFEFDGFMAIRTKDITLCKSSESNDYCRELMRREGLWKTVPRWVKKLSIGGWSELLGGLVGMVAILEDELNKAFHIGPLLAIHGKYAEIHDFDGCGRLQDVEKMSFNRITTVRFGNRYATIHAKYMCQEA